jgi:hypothetical protein
VLADPAYLPSMNTSKIAGILGSSMEELVRHHPDLKEDAFAAVGKLLATVHGLTGACGPARRRGTLARGPC